MNDQPNLDTNLGDELRVEDDLTAADDEAPVNTGTDLPTDADPADDATDSGPADTSGAEDALSQSLSRLTLGFVAFDGESGDNTTSGIMVAEEHRAKFRRDAYVGIRDDEQDREFLGRVVEGPFYAPHEIAADSAVGRTTVLHPDRTRFRPTYYAAGTVEILGELQPDGHVVPSPTRPRPYSRTYLFPPERLEAMLGLAGDFELGTLLGYDDVHVRAPGDKKSFLPRNAGIFGTVGSGKSNTTQVLMEEATAHGWAVIVVDVEGEYVCMDEPTQDTALASILRAKFGREPVGLPNVAVYVPSSGTSDARTPLRFKVPISEVESHVLGDLIELSEPQMRMLYPLIERLERSAPARTGAAAAQTQRLGGLVHAAGAPITGPSIAYTLQHLVDALDESQGYPNFGAPPKPAETSTAHALRSKLIGLGLSGVLDWGATTATSYLPVHELLTPGRLSILDVSETDDRSRNICIAYLLQALFNLVVQVDRGQVVPGTSFERPPVLVVLEEVHTFVSRTTAVRMRAVLDQLQIISRRGRKRWMGLCLVSQQPGHVPDELFELANTRFIHQLKSVSNLAPVKQTTGGVHEALWSTVPALAPGQCLLTGAVFRNPIFAAVRPAASRRMLID
jgi:DNA helicase HerA-like ATPase